MADLLATLRHRDNLAQRAATGLGERLSIDPAAAHQELALGHLGHLVELSGPETVLSWLEYVAAGLVSDDG